jgi:hypothetical protein
MERPRKNDLHKLDVYRCALQLYRRIGLIVAEFPCGEADLRVQMKRASRSVPFTERVSASGAKVVQRPMRSPWVKRKN